MEICRSASSFEDPNELWFNKSEYDCCGQKTWPLEVLVLGCLRILGRGMCLDGIQELSGVSIEVQRKFLHKFCHLFSNTQFDKYCGLPRDPEEIDKIVSEYALLGFPGCIGSTDCVHIAWDRCPYKLRFEYTGKAHYPTVSFEVTCTHSRRILACSKGFPGSTNDKTIATFDEFIQGMKNGKLFGDCEFKVMVGENGEEEILKGLYLLVDNGYQKWRCLINPDKFCVDIDTATFARHLESVRKDIECTFGILKGRFRILKIPILFQSHAVIENIFKTCCVIHNMILTEDGLDSRWESGMNWDGVDGLHDMSDVGIEIRSPVRGFNKSKGRMERLLIRVHQSLDFSTIRQTPQARGSDHVTEDAPCSTQVSLKNKLIKNLKNRLRRREVTWLN